MTMIHTGPGAGGGGDGGSGSEGGEGLGQRAASVREVSVLILAVIQL